MNDHLSQIKELIQQYESDLITKAEMFAKIADVSVKGFKISRDEEAQSS